MAEKRTLRPTGRLDTFDLKILEILQHDSTMPQRQIGERVNLSAAAVSRRVQKMEADGVIAAQVACIEPSRVGRPITIIVEVHVESERIDLLDAAKKSLSEAPEVQQCYYVTGDADFVLIVTVADMGEYGALTRRLFLQDKNVKRFRTLVVMERTKTGLAVPLDAAP